MQDESLDHGSALFAAETLLARVDALARERTGVREAADIEYIHRMRVASRRLRAALALFAGCLPGKKADGWTQGIRRITRSLGAARDIDVQIAVVETFLQAHHEKPERPGLQRLLLRLRQRRQAQQSRVERALDRLADNRVIEEMEAALRTLRAQVRMQGVEPTSPTLLALAQQAITERLTDLHSYELYVNQPERAEELHAMRIAAKRLRYTIEIFAPLYPGELKTPLKTVKTLQEQLGDIHDCDVWMATLPTFLEDEEQRALEYFGHTRGLRRLTHGIHALHADRRAFRQQRYQEFAAAWAESSPMWKELLDTLGEQASRACPATK